MLESLDDSLHIHSHEILANINIGGVCVYWPIKILLYNYLAIFTVFVIVNYYIKIVGFIER